MLSILQHFRNTVEPLWKGQEKSLKLQNLVHSQAPFFTNHVFILPLMTGHPFWKGTTLGGLYRGVPLYYVPSETDVSRHG